jgi:hypothetical protein
MFSAQPSALKLSSPPLSKQYHDYISDFEPVLPTREEVLIQGSNPNPSLDSGIQLEREKVIQGFRVGSKILSLVKLAGA